MKKLAVSATVAATIVAALSLQVEPVSAAIRRADHATVVLSLAVACDRAEQSSALLGFIDSSSENPESSIQWVPYFERQIQVDKTFSASLAAIHAVKAKDATAINAMQAHVKWDLAAVTKLKAAALRPETLKAKLHDYDVAQMAKLEVLRKKIVAAELSCSFYETDLEADRAALGDGVAPTTPTPPTTSTTPTTPATPTTPTTPTTLATPADIVVSERPSVLPSQPVSSEIDPKYLPPIVGWTYVSVTPAVPVAPEASVVFKAITTRTVIVNGRPAAVLVIAQPSIDGAIFDTAFDLLVRQLSLSEVPGTNGFRVFCGSQGTIDLCAAARGGEVLYELAGPPGGVKDLTLTLVAAAPPGTPTVPAAPKF